MRPKHLEGYDWLAALRVWQHGGPASQKRDWAIRPGGIPMVQCRLYVSEGLKIRSTEKTALTLEEAVWLALQEKFGD